MTDFEHETIERLARMEAKQDASNKATSEYMSKTDERVKNLEHTINGNGKKGIAERVRNIEWKMAIVGGGAVTAFELLKEAFLHGVAK